MFNYFTRWKAIHLWFLWKKICTFWWKEETCQSSCQDPIQESLLHCNLRRCWIFKMMTSIYIINILIIINSIQNLESGYKKPVKHNLNFVVICDFLIQITKAAVQLSGFSPILKTKSVPMCHKLRLIISEISNRKYIEKLRLRPRGHQ